MHLRALRRNTASTLGSTTPGSTHVAFSFFTGTASGECLTISGSSRSRLARWPIFFASHERVRLGRQPRSLPRRQVANSFPRFAPASSCAALPRRPR
jgi:hypothetical protein